MPLKDIRITQSGRIASESLSEKPDAVVIGTTSRGVFLNLSSKWVIFLSTESYCGPLTLNLQGFDGVLHPIEAGMPVKIDERSIDFPTTGNRFHFEQAAIWRAPPLPPEFLPVDQRWNSLVDINRELSLMQKESLFADFLAALLDDNEGATTHSNGINKTLNEMRMAILERKKGAFLNACGAVLGLGAGLTPSGDDLLSGLALALSRWGDVLLPDLGRGDIFADLITLAYEKTSLLSANLIECACQGQADERLVLALDGIMTGEHSPAQCAAALAGWGNSSGADALAGMALAVYPESDGR